MYYLLFPAFKSSLRRVVRDRMYNQHPGENPCSPGSVRVITVLKRQKDFQVFINFQTSTGGVNKTESDIHRSM